METGNKMTTAVELPKVLVVDDNAAVSRALQQLLRKQGFEPVGFEAGLPALEFIAREMIDAALIDLHLPDLPGLDVTRGLREQYGDDLPIFIVSGDNSIETLRALPEAGATYFFSKPVNPVHLIQRLKEALHARPV